MSSTSPQAFAAADGSEAFESALVNMCLEYALRTASELQTLATAATAEDGVAAAEEQEDNTNTNGGRAAAAASSRADGENVDDETHSDVRVPPGAPPDVADALRSLARFPSRQLDELLHRARAAEDDTKDNDENGTINHSVDATAGVAADLAVLAARVSRVRRVLTSVAPEVMMAAAAVAARGGGRPPSSSSTSVGGTATDTLPVVAPTMALQTQRHPWRSLLSRLDALVARYSNHTANLWPAPPTPTPHQPSSDAAGPTAATSTSASATSTSATSSFSVSASSRVVLHPLPRVASVQEAALEVYARNTSVMFRRKRPREATEDPASRLTNPTGHNNNNTNIREEDNAAAVGALSALRESQRQRRMELYTARAALLPRADYAIASAAAAAAASAAASAAQSNSNAHNSNNSIPNAITTTGVVSPAVRQYAELQACAEGEMLREAWCWATKARLLQEAPAVAAMVATRYRPLLPKANAAPSSSSSSSAPQPGTDGGSAPSPARDYVFFRFPYCGAGVVRLSVQEALLVDLTYNRFSRSWEVLRLRWNLWASAGATAVAELADATDVAGGGGGGAAPAVAALMMDPALFCDLPTAAETVGEGGEDTGSPRQGDHNRTAAARALSGDNDEDDDSVGPSARLWGARRVRPTHEDAMARHLQRAFGDGGLEAGAAAATALLGCVLLDLVAAQLAAARRGVWCGPAGADWAVEVVPGTLVSLRARPPPRYVAPPADELGTAALAGRSHAVAGQQQQQEQQQERPLLHARWELTGGVVVLRRQWGTDAEGSRTDVLLRLLREPKGNGAGVSEALREDGVPCRFVVDMEELIWADLV